MKSQKSPIDISIKRVLRKLGNVEDLEPQAFFDAEHAFKKIKWLPQYLYRVNGSLWGVDIFRGDWLPQFKIEQMSQAQRSLAGFHAAFFVPEGEELEVIADSCREQEIEIIAKLGGEYRLLELSSLPSSPLSAAVPAIRFRIPELPVNRVGNFCNLDERFRNELNIFASEHKTLITTQSINDEAEESLLKATYERLIGADERFAGTHKPLDLLHRLEGLCQSSQSRPPREHYFHSFHNFLLGCSVIDSSYNHFSQFAQMVFPSTAGFCIEYVWLLTALFHDVGQAIRMTEDLQAAAYGSYNQIDSAGIIDTQTGELRRQLPQDVLHMRASYWNCEDYRRCRNNIISLYEHLTQEGIENDWVADAFPLQTAHPLDLAMTNSFFSEGHGVASCMRLVMDISIEVCRGLGYSARQFLTRHIYLAGLSILFHDRSCRDTLRKQGIVRINTQRFPFAALLMFIDSIQDDRREPGLGDCGPDILEDLTVSGDTVEARIDDSLLTEEQLRSKRLEVEDVLAFLEQDGLRYRYLEKSSGWSI